MSSALNSYDFQHISPAGWYIAIRVGFAYPMAERNCLPEAWIERYTSRGYMLFDPVMKWLYANTGAVRWSEINISDPRNVMAEAAEFGLVYGAAVSVVEDGGSGLRSLATFVRDDREFTDDELGMLSSHLNALHVAVAPPANLTNAELEALSMVKSGLLMKQIANELGVSQGAVKQRLKNARFKLQAKTSTQAVTMASEFGLI